MEDGIPQDVFHSANLNILRRMLLDVNRNIWLSTIGVPKNALDKEEVYLAYFAELSKKLKPFTIWSRYSTLKTMIQMKRNVDISKYYKVINCHYESKKYSLNLKYQQIFI